jgi:hypothetical protein
MQRRLDRVSVSTRSANHRVRVMENRDVVQLIQTAKQFQEMKASRYTPVAFALKAATHPLPLR